MRRTSLLFLAAMGMATALAARDATAQMQSTKWHVWGGAGALILDSIDFNAAATSGGVTINAMGDFVFNPGPAISGGVGYALTDLFTVEGELGYATADYDSVNVNGTVTSGSTVITVSGTASVDGSVSMISGLANLYLTPLKGQDVEPYLGLGVGFARVNDQIDAVGGVAVNSEETDTNLVAALTAGLEVEVMPDILVGGRYRYFWANTGGNGVNDATGHILQLTGAIRF